MHLYLNNTSISKDDGELFVNLANDIFTLNTEEEIKANLKILNEVKYNGKELKKEMYDRINKLDDKINNWLKRLNEITK